MVMKVAVYQDCGILGSGNDVAQALDEAGYKLSNVVDFSGGFSSCYDLGVVVNLSWCKRVSADDEACSGASAKIRYITDRLFNCLGSDSFDGCFIINSDGYLDLDIES